MSSFLWAMAAVAMVVGFAAVASAQELSVAIEGQGRFLRIDSQRVLELSSPWVATAGFGSLYRFPAGVSAGEARSKVDSGEYGKWTETITPAPGAVTIRYEFDMPANEKAAHVQWVWRLEPGQWNGILAEGAEGSAGQPEQAVPLHPLEGLRIANLKRMDFVLADADLSVTCRAADGEWSFQDARSANWAKCYRLEYNRDYSLKGRRSGWFEVTITAKKATSPLVALTQGTATEAQGMKFAVGPLREPIGQTLGTLVFLHTVSEEVMRGKAGGEITVVYADGAKQTMTLLSGTEFSSPSDDPRSVGNGGMVMMANGQRAWVSQWRNPRPGAAIAKLETRSVAGGWKLLAASGTDTSADPKRVAAVLRGNGEALAEETVISLDGTWKLSCDRVAERDIAVPGFWDREQGLRDVRQATYRRTFDVPATFSGRRVSLKFDAVGDAAEVWVNGRMAGGAISPALPFELDITGLVRVPSTSNLLEVRVKDDSHFGIPRNDVAWRNIRHWIPRGMGAHNRKGLYQSVSLRAKPAVRIEDARIQTSVRKREIAVIYTVRNTGKETVRTRIESSVRRTTGGEAVVTLPSTEVEVPGYVTTSVTVKAAFEGVESWQPDHPTLYELRSLLMDGQRRLQRVDTRFGFREVWFEESNFYLNGIRCNLRGESPAYSEKIDLMQNRPAAEEMIRRYQKVNFNVLRFHSMPAPPYVLDACDEMGMLVIDESAIYASWGMLMPEHPQWMDNCREHLSKWVRRDRNHPAVVLWSAENEGLNVNGLTPAQLAEFRKMIDAEDGTRPVIFDGDGRAMGASPASVKHYVSTVADLKNPGGVSSGYGRDLRNDIYWATEFVQDFPLGCGEFLFPYEPGLRDKERECIYMMGLQTRGYRLANWFDIRPYNPSYSGFLRPEGLRPTYEEVYDIVVKSFAPVAVFDKEYDALGPFPAAPTLAANKEAKRELIVYNDTFAGEMVEVEWIVRQGWTKVAGEKLTRKIPLGDHVIIPISFTPGAAGKLELDLISRKDSKEVFRDTRAFEVR